MADMSLSAAVRTSLQSLQQTTTLLSQTQNSLPSGLGVTGPVDDLSAYFDSKASSDSSGVASATKDNVGQGLSVLSTSLDAIDSISATVKQMLGIAQSLTSATGDQTSALTSQFNSLLDQITSTANSATTQGVNLVNGSGQGLSVGGSESSFSLTIASVDLTANGLQISALSISASSSSLSSDQINGAVSSLQSAQTTLSTQAESFSLSLTKIQGSLGFSSASSGTASSGTASQASISVEGASLLALQTRQQLSGGAQSLASQSEGSILSLFR